jgi:hypothetical protein
MDSSLIFWSWHDTNSIYQRKDEANEEKNFVFEHVRVGIQNIAYFNNVHKRRAIKKTSAFGLPMN